MAGTITQALKLTTQLDPAGLNALGSKMDELDAHADRSSGLWGKLGGAIKAATVIGGAAGIAGLGYSVKVAADFEAQINAIGASTGATTDQLKLLHDAALQVGKDTPKSASEAAEAFGELARAGIAIPDIVAGVGRATVDLAVSQGAAVPAMSQLLVGALSTWGDSLQQYGDKTAQAQHASQVLASAASTSAVDINDIALSMQMVGPVAAQAGLSIDDFGAAIGILGNNALRGSDAGTSLKMMLLNLMAPTSTAAGMMDQYGIKVYDATGKIRPFRDILANLQDSLGGVSEEERNMAMRVIFGTDAIRAGNILVKEGTAGWDAFNQQMGKAPTLQEQTAQRMKGLSGQIEQFKGSAETLGIMVGEKLLPMLTRLATGATNVLNALIEGDWGKAAGIIGDGLLDGLRALVGWGGELAGWLGDQLAAVDWGSVWAGIQDLGARLWGGLRRAGVAVLDLAGWLGDQLSAVDWASVWANVKTGGVQLFGTGFLDVASTVETIATFIDTQALPAVQRFFGYLREQVAPAVLNVTKDVFAWLADHPEVLIGAAAGIGTLTVAWTAYNIVTGIAAIVTGAVLSPIVLITAAAAALGAGVALLITHWDELVAKFPWLGELADGVGAKLRAFGDWLQADFLPAASAVFTGVVSAVASVLTFITTNWDTVSALLAGPLQMAKAYLSGIWSEIQIVFQTAFGVIRGLFETFSALFRGDWEGVWNGIRDTFGAIWDGVLATLNNELQLIVGLAEGAWTTVLNTAGFLWGQISTAVTGAAHGIWQWFQDNWVDILGTVMLGPFYWFRDQLGDAATGVLGTIWSNVSNAFSGLMDWFKTVFVDVKNLVMWPFEWIRDNAGGVLGGLANILLAPFKLVLSGLDSFGGGIVSALNWVLNDALHLGVRIPSPPSLAALIPTYARGTDDHPGGLALVGEAGPELALLPPGTAILPADRTRRLLGQYGATEIQRLPGYQFGLNPDDVLDVVRALADPIGTVIREWKNNPGGLAAEALRRFGVTGDWAGNFLGIPQAIFTAVKDGLVQGLTQLLGIVEQGLPPDQAPGAPGTSPPLAGTGWVKPLAGGYAITTYFGQPGQIWSRGWHSGMDLASFSGDVVRAALGGTASNLGDGGSGFGQHVVIAHGGGLQSIYAHLGSFLTGGGGVSTGQPIGTEDNTGLSTGTHLHFEIDLNGSPVNPLSYVRLASGTRNWPGGWAWVGEAGPELAYLPHGAAVLPNPVAMALAGGARYPGFAGGNPLGNWMPADAGGWAAFLKQLTDQMDAIRAGLEQAHADYSNQMVAIALANQGVSFSMNALGQAVDASGRVLGQIDQHTLDTLAQGDAQLAQLQAQYDAAVGTRDSTGTLAGTVGAGSVASRITNAGEFGGAVGEVLGDVVATVNRGDLSFFQAWFGSEEERAARLPFRGKIPGVTGEPTTPYPSRGKIPGFTTFQHGGILREPVVGYGRSGRRYSFAESGPEWFGGVGNTAQTVYQFGDVTMTIPVERLREFTAVVDVLGSIAQTARARTGGR